MDYKDLHMYNLFVDKENRELSIKKVLRRGHHLGTKYTEEVQYYNEYYFVSLSRKALKDKALEIKKQWSDELESDLLKVKNIKI